MHLWKIDLWKNNPQIRNAKRKGIRFRFDASVHPDVRSAFLNFAEWLRLEYYFPIRIPVYVKGTKTIRTKDGCYAVGSFFEPYSFVDEPYVRIATGDYEKILNLWGKDDALASILSTLTHELSHYYQWINEINLTPIGMERQATRYSKIILNEYATTRDHP